MYINQYYRSLVLAMFSSVHVHAASFHCSQIVHHVEAHVILALASSELNIENLSLRLVSRRLSTFCQSTISSGELLFTSTHVAVNRKLCYFYASVFLRLITSRPVYIFMFVVPQSHYQSFVVFLC